MGIKYKKCVVIAIRSHLRTLSDVNLAACVGNAVCTLNCESPVFLHTEVENTGGLLSGRPT